MNKIYLSLTILVLLSLECFGQENIDPETTRIVINNSIGLGSVITVVISWEETDLFYLQSSMALSAGYMLSII